MNIEKEREAFEALFKEKLGAHSCQFDLDSDGNYEDRETACAWHMYLAGINKKLEGCVVVNTESLLLHAQSIRMFNDGDMENHYEEIEEHVCAIEEMVEAARGGNE